MDYKMNGVSYIKSILDIDSIDSESVFGNLKINDTNKVYTDTSKSVYSDKSIKIEPSGCMYLDGFKFKSEDESDYIQKEFTIDFWFYFDQSYSPGIDTGIHEESDKFTEKCTNPYLFVFGTKNPLFSYLVKDNNGYHWIPQVIAVGYDSVSRTLSVYNFNTVVKQKQSGVNYPSNTIFFYNNSTYFYVEEDKINASKVSTIVLNSNTWHHLSFSFNRSKEFDARLRIDFGEEISTYGSTFTTNSTLLYPPNKTDLIALGNYGQCFFKGNDIIISIGNQAIGIEQSWLKFKLTSLGSSYNYGNLYISNLRMVDGYIDIIPDKIVVVINNNAYGVINREFKQIAIKWSLLNADQRLECIKSLDQDAYPDIEELQDISINESDSIIIESYTAQYTNTSLNLRMDLDHKAIIEPKELWDVGIYGEIQQVTVDFETSGNGKIMVSPTYDAMNGLYMGFNFTTMQWFAIAASEIATKGIQANQLGAIPKSAWTTLGNKLAFAYYIESENLETDKANLKSINMLCEISESQVDASDQTDYEYAYLSPSKVLFRFLTNGTYKVTYFDKEDE